MSAHPPVAPAPDCVILLGGRPRRRRRLRRFGLRLDDGVASLKSASDTKADDDSDTTAKSDKDPEDAMLDFARCMREHGVDMPDPDTSGGGPGVGEVPRRRPSVGRRRSSTPTRASSRRPTRPART